MLGGFSCDSDGGFILQVGGKATSEPQKLLFTFLGSSYRPEDATAMPGPLVLEIANAVDRRGMLTP
jgi:hypothetical protein